jgi:hypothetical protein
MSAPERVLPRPNRARAAVFRSGPTRRWVVGGAVVLSGVLGVLSGWVWSLLFLGAAVVVGTLVRRRPWLVVGLVAATLALVAVPDGAVKYVGILWMWTAAHVGAAAVLAGARRWMPAGSVVLWHVGLLLPRVERDSWRAEVFSVLHACDDTERRQQTRGFLFAVPATVIASWRWR